MYEKVKARRTHLVSGGVVTGLKRIDGESVALILHTKYQKKNVRTGDQLHPGKQCSVHAGTGPTEFDGGNECFILQPLII